MNSRMPRPASSAPRAEAQAQLAADGDVRHLMAVESCGEGGHILLAHQRRRVVHEGRHNGHLLLHALGHAADLAPAVQPADPAGRPPWPGTNPIRWRSFPRRWALQSQSRSCRSRPPLLLSYRFESAWARGKIKRLSPRTQRGAQVPWIIHTTVLGAEMTIPQFSSDRISGCGKGGLDGVQAPSMGWWRTAERGPNQFSSLTAEIRTRSLVLSGKGVWL